MSATATATTTQEQLEESAKENRTLLFLEVGAAAFVAITVAGARDCDIVSPTSGLKLPLIDVEVSVHAFYWVMPPLLWALAVYVHLEVLKIVDAAAELRPPQWWPSSVLAHAVKQKLSLRQIFKEHVRTQQVLAIVERALTDIVVWWAVPITLAIACVRLLPFAERMSFKWCALWLLIAVLSSIWVRQALRGLRMLRNFRRWAIAVGAGILACFFGLRCVTAPRVKLLAEALHWRLVDFRAADLHGASLHSKYAPGAIFEKATLRHATLKDSRLNEASFDAADLEDATLTGANLQLASFRGSNLQRAVLNDADARRASFEGADLKGAFLRHTRLGWTNFSGANLSRYRFDVLSPRNESPVYFVGAIMEDVSFRGVSLGASSFTRANLTRANFAQTKAPPRPKNDRCPLWFNQATLIRANFLEAELPQVAFDDADLTDANLTSAHFDEANFSGAKLVRVSAFNATFKGATMLGIDLQDSNLTSARLEGANLGNANLQGARVAGAHLEGSNLAGARLSGAELTNTVFQGAIYDRFTVFPTGFDPAARGLISRERSAPPVSGP